MSETASEQETPPQPQDARARRAERQTFYNKTRRERYNRNKLEETIPHCQGIGRELLQSVLDEGLWLRLKKHDVDSLVLCALLLRPQPLREVVSGI